MQGASNLGRLDLRTFPQVLNDTGISAWHAAGWTGREQTIGVLDQGFGGLLSFQERVGESVTVVVPGASATDYDANPITHGTNVLEVANVVAPDAQFYVCAYLDFSEFGNCIDWMIRLDVKILVHSVGVPVLPLDGSGDWAREVDRAAQSGMLWVNAAGNFARGFLRDSFTDRQINTYHEFRGTGVVETLAVSPINLTEGRVMLSWGESGRYAANEIDFDLEVVDSASEVIAVSARQQRGNPGERPLEVVQIDMSRPFGIRIRNIDGRGDLVNFVLFVEFAYFEDSELSGSIISPGDSRNALAVGALQGRFVAPYSSQGPLTSGQIKPDLTAPGEIIFPDGRVFVGTSAAAPIVAGVSALVWQANPTWDNEDVFRFIRNDATLDDTEIPGLDPRYGNGRLFLPAIVDVSETPTTAETQATSSPTASSTASSTPTPSPTTSATPTATETSDRSMTSTPEYRCIYRVQPGDSLFRIASAYGVEVNELLELNDLTLRSVILPGQLLIVRIEECRPLEPLTGT
jgi:subtilisin family serine protease